MGITVRANSGDMRSVFRWDCPAVEMNSEGCMSCLCGAWVLSVLVYIFNMCVQILFPSFHQFHTYFFVGYENSRSSLEYLLYH
jgi:hypothetical protein